MIELFLLTSFVMLRFSFSFSVSVSVRVKHIYF
jgi:hypothetical protein